MGDSKQLTAPDSLPPFLPTFRFHHSTLIIFRLHSLSSSCLSTDYRRLVASFALMSLPDSAVPSPSTPSPTSRPRPRSDRRHPVLSYGLVILSGVLYAIALKYFVLPSQVVLTGTEGIAVALSYYFESESLFILLYFVFQALLILFAFFAVSRTFAFRSALVVATVVLLLLFLPAFQVADPDPKNERIILVLFGGLLAGVAKAIAFQNRGSTGDEDILGAYFAMKYLKPVGNIAVFAAIVSTGFGLLLAFLKTGQFEPVANTLMYTCIYIFASAETLNNLYRKFQLTMLSVISRHHERIGEAIRDCSPHRTYTAEEAQGGFSKESFWVVRTIITHEELPDMLEAVQKVDPKCFHYHQDIEGISRGYFIEPIG
jgi:uncharacterized membrane-anchored protein YitT (DUF2179 family)